MIWYSLLLLSLLLIGFYKVFPYGAAVVNTPLRRFLSALQSDALMYSSQVSLFWSFVNTSLLLVFSLLLAWNLRHRRKLLLSILFAPWAIPLYLSAMIMRFSVYGVGGRSPMSWLGLNVDIVTDPWAAFLWTSLINVWVHLPLVVLSFLAAIDDIPKEMIEAAKIDGASDAAVLFSIVVPEIGPVIHGWFLLNFVRFFHSFTLPFIFANGGVIVKEWITKWGGIGNLTTLGILNYKVFSNTWDLGEISAYSAVSMILILFLSLYWLFRESPRKISIVTALFSTVWFFMTGNLSPLILFFMLLFPEDKLLGSGLSLLSLFFGGWTVLPAYAYLIWCGVHLIGRFSMVKDKYFDGVVRGIALALFLIAALLSIFAVVSVFLTAFTDYPDTLKVTNMTFDGFKKIFAEDYSLYLKNSLYLSIPIALFLPFVTLPLAHSMARGREFFLHLFILLQASSGIHLLVQIFVVYSKFQLLNSLFWVLPLIASGAMLQIVVIERGFIKNFPRELEDLALVDGGESLKRRMIFRYSLPIIGVASLIGFMAGWNAFVGPLLFIFEESKLPASVKMYDYVGNLQDKYPEWNAFGAAAVINLVVVLLVFVINRWISGKFKMIK